MILQSKDETMTYSTKKWYETDGARMEFDATVLSCEKAGEGYDTILSETAFFPGGGGQERDEGTLDGVPVTALAERDGAILHRTGRPFPVGARVHGKLDALLRLRRMQAHSGEHVLSGLLHSLYGSENVGFRLGEGETVTIDTSKHLTDAELDRAEYEANLAVAKNLPVTVSFPDEKELASLVYRSKKELSGRIRIVTVEGVDVCACCAPHVARTGEIGQIRILSRMTWKGGLRLTVLCGLAAYEDAKKKNESVKRISALLSAKPEEVAEAAERMRDRLEEESRKAGALAAEKREAALRRLREREMSDGPVVLWEEELSRKDMTEYANELQKKTRSLAVVLTREKGRIAYTAASGTLDMRKIAPRIGEALSGSGGGSPSMIFGSADTTREKAETFFRSFIPSETDKR